MDILHNISLKKYNTFGIEAHAASFAEIRSVNDLHMLLQSASILPVPHSGDDLLILGGGSNVLFTRDFDGLVLKNGIKGIEIRDEGPDRDLVRSGAGEVWDDLVRFCVERELGGLENLSGIPGSVGASPIQNIGAYGTEMKECFDSLEAFELESGEIKRFTRDECRLGYRDSIFKHELKGQYIILSVDFTLPKKASVNLSYRSLAEKFSGLSPEKVTPSMVREAVLDIRSSKLPDPEIIGNAGSFFKNPLVGEDKLNSLLRQEPALVYFQEKEKSYKLAAGWLIEQCGWKGFREGDAGVHGKQALVIVNHSNATGKQILDLAMKVKSSVKDRFSIELEPEVRIY